MPKLKVSGLQVLVHIAALLPLILLAWDFTQGGLTANPIREVQLRTGKYALVLLVLALSLTPVNIVFGIKSVLPIRRTLGLYSLMYASLHFLNFIGLDYRFDFGLIRDDISGKRFVLVGFVAFLCLLPLAVTSTRGWIRRLGRNWERLHRLIYVAAVLAVTHFLWQVKADVREPLIYGAVVALLLIVRIPPVRKALSELRKKWHRKPKVAP
jgi:sulfoxide reductase heme-binding subunit YedZ